MAALRQTRGWVLAALIAAGVTSTTSVEQTAWAADQPLDKREARALFQEGLALVAAGNYSSALQKLERVASFKRTPQVQFYIAFCHEKLGKLVIAYGEYRIALADARGDPTAKQVVDEAGEAIASLKPRIPTLIVRRGKAARTAQIKIDGKPFTEGAEGKPMLVDPGTVVIEATAKGYEPFTRELRLEEGAAEEIEVELTAKSSVAASPPPKTPASKPVADTPPTETAEPSSSGARTAIGWVALGIGVASSATSGVFFARRASAINDLESQCGTDGLNCPASARDRYDTGKRDTMIANVTLGVGIAGVLGGVILLVAGRGQEPIPDGKSVRVVPSSPGTVAGLSLTGPIIY